MTANAYGLRLRVREYPDDRPTILELRGAEPDDYSYIDPELQARVEAAIREYPLTDALQWLGGVAAIRVVEDWLVEHGFAPLRVIADGSPIDHTASRHDAASPSRF